MHLVGGLGILAILAPARIIGVDDGISASPSSASAEDLPVPHPVTKTLAHGNATECTATSRPCASVFRECTWGLIGSSYERSVSAARAARDKTASPAIHATRKGDSIGIAERGDDEHQQVESHGAQPRRLSLDRATIV